MPIQERIDSVAKQKSWEDVLSLDYIYTAGIAGEKFFTELKKGRIVASRCDKCKISYLPPKLYCVKCFSKLEKYIDVGLKGKVAAVTYSYFADTYYAFVTFNSVTGGLIHRVLDTRTKIGDTVIVRFRKERKGSITDIEGFALGSKK
ncbi:MAG: zinc ribbon domain-containing protein [Nitrososphaerota archaeon]